MTRGNRRENRGMQRRVNDGTRLAPIDPETVVAAARDDRWRSVAVWFRCLAPKGVIWLAPLALGYFLSYLFRTINGVLAGDLSRDLSLGTSALGLLTAVYFLPFAMAQLPLGALLDRFGAKRVQPLALVVAACGAVLCASGLGFYGMLAGRALIGLGMAAPLMAGLKAAAEWFPRERLPLVNGGLIMFGGLGAMAATWPVEIAERTIGWRALFAVLALATLLVAACAYAVVPKRPAREIGTDQQGMRIREILRDPMFRRFAPLSAACVGSVFALQGVWAGPFLAEVHGFDRRQVASGLFLMALALIGAAPFWGVLVGRLRHRLAPAQIAFWAAMVLVAIETAAATGSAPGILVWTSLGVFGGYTVISFSAVAEHFPSNVIGRANAALNTMHILVAFAMQFGFGELVGLWPQRLLHAPPIAYQSAMLLPICIQVLALLWFIASSPAPRAATDRAALEA